MDSGRKGNLELVTTDMFSLNDTDLRQHINDLQAERNCLKNSVVPSVGECNTLIALAYAELSARASDRLAKRALYISLAAVLISCGASVLEIAFG
jgi:hypothetical protein